MKRNTFQSLGSTKTLLTSSNLMDENSNKNFLFTSKDEHSPLKAIYFGLSDYVKPDERLNDIVESAYYVAPEVLHRSYGPEADMWSIGHPWLANYHDVKIPLDMIIYKLVKAYICSSSLRKVALGAVAKNSTEAMKDSRVLDYAHMMSTLQYRKLDFEEFCAAAISVHQLEGMENWEQHACSAYELFEKDGKNPTMIEELASVVDGKLSQTCHLMALDSCYKSFCKKYEKLEGKQFSADDADYFVFHSPYNKRVQKSFARLVFSDYLWNASSVYEAAEEKLAPFSSLTDDERYTSRDLEKASQQVAKPLYDAKVQPTTLVPKQVGNMYTASLYAAFVSLIHNKHSSLITDFCNDLQKLATRVKESEIAERGNGKKRELDVREKEWKPLLEVNKEKCEIVEKGNVKEKLRKK
ncbi:hypothetical protein RHGRI_007412 [Rhododendron griersonianum]|uniref:Protein kinase domain-containing protein n=1 Tax=Rhododendron griersonianum TaxID=479676 RepID=A0AAV6KXG2_9ERIC|nr:hypothetical protein RHGRI_007412 [Rhododendron griersonianum]